MSLYYVQKLLYQLNRDPDVRRRYDNDFNGLIEAFDLKEEEATAIRKPNLGFRMFAREPNSDAMNLDN